MHFLLPCAEVMACICIRRTAQQSRRTNNYDIDEFINQLLKSQKFDELTEIVAEKAVKRIKNIDSQSVFTDVVDHNNNNEDKKYEQQDLDGKESKVKTFNEDERLRKKKNIHAVIKESYDSSATENLTLKYKDLINKHIEDKKMFEDKRVDPNEHNPVWKNPDDSNENQTFKSMFGEENNGIGPRKPDVIINQRANDYDRNPPSAENNSMDKYDNSERTGPFLNSENFDSNTNIEKSNKPGRNSYGEKPYHMNFENTNNYVRNVNNEKKNEGQILTHNDGQERNRYNYGDGVTEGYKPFQLLRQFDTDLKENLDDLNPTTYIDLDDNSASHGNKPNLYKPKKIYKQNIEQQKVKKKEYHDDEQREDKSTMIFDNVKNINTQKIWGEERNLSDENINSNDDDNIYGTVRNRNENAVTSPNERDQYSTRKKKVIRKEGNRFYTYLSAPEYAEYHEMLAKQQQNQNPYDNL